MTVENADLQVAKCASQFIISVAKSGHNEPAKQFLAIRKTFPNSGHSDILVKEIVHITSNGAIFCHRRVSEECQYLRWVVRDLGLA